MQELVVCWVVFPLVLALLSLGCGLLLASLAGAPIEGALLLPAGFCVIVVVCLFTTSNSVTPTLTAPAVCGLAAAGLLLSWTGSRPRLDRWAAAAAAGALLAVGAPIIASGSATFAGYIQLDDTASWLAMSERLLSHGRNLAGIEPSTYWATLNYYWNQYGYPVGAFPPLGIGHVLLGTDAAWLFQPYLGFLAAMLALAAYSIAGRLVEPRPVRALIAFVAAQPALLYGYIQWGGVKEVATAAVLVLTAALAPGALVRDASPRRLLPLATATAALIGILNLSAGIWLAPLLVPVLAIGIRRFGRTYLWRAAWFAGWTVVLSIPSLAIANGFTADVGLNAKGGDIGNLVGPLSLAQVAGIWPVKDFRYHPSDSVATYVLVACVVGAAAVGVWWAVRRRVLELPLVTAAALVGCGFAVHFGSAWIAGKALAIASPVPILAALIGAAWLWTTGRHTESAVLTAALVGGVLWSNVLAYQNVWLAPRSQLTELETIGKRFAGDGPTLMTEYSPIGARYLLRNLAPESAGELRIRTIPLRSGGVVAKGDYADIDDFDLTAVLEYRTLVVMHDGSSSRPPSVYHLVWAGTYYDVWQRPLVPPARILDHLSLGTDTQPAAVPRCADVMGLARLARGERGRLVAVPRPPAIVAGLDEGVRTPTWAAYTNYPGVVFPASSGQLVLTVEIPKAGRYGVWLGGSFTRKLSVYVDDRFVGSAQDERRHPGVYTPFGHVTLAPGVHTVRFVYSAASLSPGSGGPEPGMGPLVLSTATDRRPLVSVPPGAAATLCGNSLDWIEAVTG